MSKEVHVAHGIKALWEDLPPIREKKHPLLAGIIGFMFGGIGLGLYFQSWKDFLYPVLAWVALAIVIPGLGLILAAIFSATWGAARAANSG